jgi:cobalt-zinc-cadmium efflux system outer membrane protein
MPEDGREAASGIGVAFAFPLGPRLQRADDLNAAKAASAEVDLQARTRELYMQLRAAYAEVSLRRNQVGEKAALVGSAAESAELAIKLAEIGTATRLDVNLLELEFQERRLAVADAESAVVEAETALATLLGVPHSTLAGRALQALRFEGQWPALVELRSLLVENHADLARLRADFAEADAALRLELARQIPDLELGAAFEQEVGEQTDLIGIGIGIELPVFDRNQQEIAAARGEREAVRVRYESTLSAALADLDGALVRYRLLSERRAMLEQDLLPRAKSALADAEKLLAAGAIEALRLLELQRGERQALLELMEAEAERVRAMLAIESAIGRPFFLLPGERLPEVK